MFWGISFLCEEYSVPALALFCKRNKIPDHITGSIFIGTGLSLPVFFVALIGLFVSNSAIGVGAVVGGNLFNHLITIPTTIYVTPNKVLKLDPFVFTRELICYLISCFVLIWSTQNRNIRRGLKDTLSEDQWESCLSIPWTNSLVLLIFFLLYCLLNAFFDNIVDSCYYVYNQIIDSCSSWLPEYFPLRDASVVEETLEIKRKSFVSILVEEVGGGKDPLSDEVSSLSMEIVDRSLEMRTISDHPINEALELAAAVAQEENKRDSQHSNHPSTSHDDKISMKVAGSTIDAEEQLHGHSVNVLAMPEILIELPFWLICFPMRFAIYMTVPDVRRPVHRHRAILSMTVCLFWLFVQSLILTESLTLLANFWGINSAVMGLTVAAWASNYPAHWSSVVVAKESSSSSADDIACKSSCSYVSCLLSELMSFHFSSLQCVRIEYFQQLHRAGSALDLVQSDLPEALQ
jgi:sodium/potassium/calcium exchanger 4